MAIFGVNSLDFWGVDPLFQGALDCWWTRNRIKPPGMYSQQRHKSYIMGSLHHSWYGECTMESRQVLSYPNCTGWILSTEGPSFVMFLPVFANSVIQRSTIIPDSTNPHQIPLKNLCSLKLTVCPSNWWFENYSHFEKAYFTGTMSVSGRE